MSDQAYADTVKDLQKSLLADNINHPSHYTRGGIETISFIEAKGLNYHLGNVVKYVTRAGYKEGSDYTDDLEKAAWYLYREIDRAKKP